MTGMLKRNRFNSLRVRFVSRPSLVPGLVLTGLLLAPLGSARAQFFGLGGATIIKDARVLTGDGETLEKVSISISGDRITDVGAAVKGGLLAKAYDASGKTITPGFIDPYSRLGVLLPGGSRADAGSRVFDAWDSYAADVFAEAFRNGVTTVYVGPRGAAGILGTGAVVALSKQEGGRIGRVIQEDAALHINLGSDQPVISRLGTFNGVRRQFREAIEYRNSIEDYKSDLEEYEKKIKERAEKKAKEEADKKGKTEGEKKPSDKPEPKDGDKKESDRKEPEKKEPGPAPAPPKPNPHPPHPKPPGVFSDEEEDVPEGSGLDAPTAPAGQFADPPTPEGGKPAAAGEKKEEEIKKPAEPRPDRDKDLLLKAIDRKLSVRIEAHRSEDILNALDLAREFNLDIIIEGATEAYFVAQALADAKVPVVLGAATRGELLPDNEFRRHSSTNAAVLEQAGVRWAVGSGSASVASGRFVLQNAQLVAAWVRPPASALELVTSQSADFLGLEAAGRVRRGRRADLVVWSGDPRDPASRVERVYVAGKVVFEATAK